MTEALLKRPFTGLLEVPESSVKIGGLYASSKALFIALMLACYPEMLHFVVATSEEAAKNLLQDLRFYLKLLGMTEARPRLLPEGDNLKDTGHRLQCILEAGPSTVVVGSERAYMRPTWKAEDLKNLSLRLVEGMTLERPALVNALQRLNYRRSSLVKQRGEFIDRQWVVDIWPVTEDNPIRVEFFGDEIDRIKRVEPETQRSVEDLKETILLPAFETQGQQAFVDIQERGIWYLDETSQLPSGISRPALKLLRMKLTGAKTPDVETLYGLGLTHRERNSFEGIAQRTKELLNRGFRFIYVLITEAQAKALKELFRDHSLVVPTVPTESILHTPEHPVIITYGRLSEGIKLNNLLIVSSSDLFGPVPVSRVRTPSVRRLLERLEDLNPGDYVVHQDYGIGIFRGLTKLTTQAGTTEALTIEYRDGARLYVPTYHIGLVDKYRAEESVIPQLDPLDARAFRRKKERLRKKIQELAYKLLNLYARRHVIHGHAFTRETILHREFEDLFPYEPTEDQLKAWEEIKRDMESPRPMDRLLAGDVGFGKTELAMRAAFKAVFDKKQVALVVPTTILCEQHYINFKERFRQFGITVDYLSRFKSKKEIEQTLRAIQQGRVDIIIGTHLLLGPRVRFKDLGLLIIDEEHRFGVAQKERLKEMKKDVDCLSLSATPIPRTLEMALSGLRPVSVLESPPEDRLAVQGIVTEYRPEVIKQAVMRELQRGGQVFFVHNRVKDIGIWKDRLRDLLPGVKIALAHGQMKEKELEEIILGFFHGEYDLLLCTNIIGSGIDIPRANTIIINEAHRMGLADLYQLKGRVGRSTLQAYAYFIVPPLESLTEEARRRISAIEELNYLGAGLHLAMRDLEIRGAGNLLGKEQSGHIHALGFDLYMKMLKEEIEHLQGRPSLTVPEPEIDLKVDAYIPDDYIQDIAQKVNIYRRFYQTESEAEVDEVLEELNDRFGPLPEEVLAYAEVMKLRAICRGLGVKAVVFLKDMVKVLFHRAGSVSAEAVMEVLRDREFRFLEDGFIFVLSGDSVEVLKKTMDILRQLRHVQDATASIHTPR